jgi:hypothetical protein
MHRQKEMFVFVVLGHNFCVVINKKIAAVSEFNYECIPIPPRQLRLFSKSKSKIIDSVSFFESCFELKDSVLKYRAKLCLLEYQLTFC